MKIKKNLSIFTIIMSLLCSLCSISYAAEPKEFGYTEQEINAMSDDEYVAFIQNVVVDKTMEYNEKQNRLKKIGVTLSIQNELIRKPTASNSDTKLEVYYSHRTGQSYYYITAWVSALRNLSTDADEEDIISIEWDPTKATYYNTTDGINTSPRDGDQKNNGIYLFNLYDKNLTASTQYAICSVLVVPKTSDITIDIASKYCRTYEKDNISWSGGVNFTYNPSSGITGGGTFSLTGNKDGRFTQLYVDTIISL